MLVVDDASFMRDMVKRGLRTSFPGFEADEAVNGRDALTKLEKGKYDLVLCDWEMPEMSGAELLEWLRDNEETKDIPFIMITSRGDRENVMQAVELKVSNYIVKPFTNEKLSNVITSVMSKALGVSADKLKRMGGGRNDFANDSAAILMAHSSGGAAAPTPAAEETPVPAKSAPAEEAPRVVRPSGKVVAQLRFSGHTITCLIRELSLERVMAVVRRADTIPDILDLAVLDIELDGEISRLNGYVHTLQARENRQESEFINIIINLVDQDDPEKMDHLNRYMDSIA